MSTLASEGTCTPGWYHCSTKQKFLYIGLAASRGLLAWDKLLQWDGSAWCTDMHWMYRRTGKGAHLLTLRNLLCFGST
jgi:hypothetical protein